MWIKKTKVCIELVRGKPFCGCLLEKHAQGPAVSLRMTQRLLEWSSVSLLQSICILHIRMRVHMCIFMWVSHMLWIWFEGCFLWFRLLLAVFLQMFFFLIAEKLLVPISKNENKPLQTLPTLAKPAAALQTFNSAILTPVSNNNTGFLRNLLNSSGGKVCDISALACVDTRLRLLFCGCSHHRHLSQ